jgi:hypothetical protein
MFSRFVEKSLGALAFLSKLTFLKGPKHEILESEFFTQIRPVGQDDLGIGEKIWHFASWSLCLKVFATNIFFSVCSACAS